jgi:hypothetical protein
MKKPNAMESAQAELARKREEAARDVPPGIEITSAPRGVFAKLASVQARLNAPKSKRNTFGKYNYRSAEDILEAVKPLLADVRAAMVISDRLHVERESVYIEATATFVDTDSGQTAAATAYAREPLTKKGMDESQITGAASSYARKYALNGLLLIDDSRDADSMPPPAENNNNQQIPDGI